MPKGENSGGAVRKPSVIGKNGQDREDFGLSLEETGAALGMTKYAIWQRERAGIRNLWRFSVCKALREKRIDGLITRIVLEREARKA